MLAKLLPVARKRNVTSSRSAGLSGSRWDVRVNLRGQSKTRARFLGACSPVANEPQQLVEALLVHAHKSMESLRVGLEVLEERVEVAVVLSLPENGVNAEPTSAATPALPGECEEQGGGD